jgi:hypothetical protein
VIYAFNGFQPLVLGVPFIETLTFSPVSLSFTEFFVSVILLDYLITAIVGFIEGRPVLSIYGVGFFVLRMVDAITLLAALPIALFWRSRGRWISPVRRA